LFAGPSAPGSDGRPVVYAFWHGQQLMMIPCHRDRGIVGLASLSRDGSLLARVIELFGYDVVRGSSSKGGGMALRGCLDALREGRSPGVAVDGPKGPRWDPQPGAVVMAARSQRSIVYVVGHCSWKVTLKSWDRFAIPGPFARIRLFYGELSPPDDCRDQIEATRQVLGKRMREVGSETEDAPVV
jgi:lysophospholipid acyltransferase (LPLAT)-like uncharacterized protein